MLIMLEAALSNAVTMPLLALLVLAVSRFRARPALMHVLWLLVLVKLFAPPLVWVPPAGIPSFAVTASEEGTGQAGGDSTIEKPQPFVRRRFAPNAGPDPVWEEQATAEAVLDPSGSTLPIDAVATERPTPLSSRSGSPIPTPATIHPLGPVPEGEVSTVRPVHDVVAGGAEAVRAASVGTVVPVSRRTIAVIGTVWLAGSVVWLLMAAVPIIRFQRLLRFARTAAPELRAEVQQLSARLGLVRAPEVVLVPARISPLVWPVGRLRLVFPEGLFEGMAPEQRATLLVHELAHVRRRDHWVRWLELGATLAYWWHPVLWWARSRLRRAEEECCDAWVVQTWPERSHTYASALLAVVGFLSGSRNGAAGRFLPASGLGQLRALRRRLALIYEGSTAARLTKRGRVALAGLAIVLLPLLPVLARIESSHASTSQQARANALDGASLSEPHGLVQRGPFSKDRLPIECEVLYASVSPDGRKVAYVGSYHDAIAGAQHGLYVVVLETGQVRRLLDTPGLKTRPAWSPDSRKLAIGNAPGYRSRYPLVIVDAQSGEVDRTGVDGVGAAWSPDGRFIAMTTETQRGGSWSAGVPTDGRIGVWDVASGQLTAASPAGFHVRDGVTGDFARSGALRPLWSPDSRWIAYEQITSTRVGNAESDLRQTWLVDRDAKQLRRVLDEAQALRWSEDSRFLIAGDTQKQQRIEVSRLPLVAPDDWPKPPERLVAASKEADEVTARAAQFDAAPILERNRPWQNPELDHLQSVQFTHRMEPVRLDERFAWRRDGTAFMQVVHREDQRAAEEVGRLSLITPQLHRYFLRPDAKYPKHVDVTREEVADYVRDHLMGTRTSFVALDWGRNPASFETVGVRDEAERGQVVISLAPRRTRQRRRYDLNAGAMFETTSWAYVHNLRVLRSELTVDAASHRILREVDYDGNGKVLCEGDFSEWLDVAEGQSVPRRIHLHFPAQEFDVDYRFEWLPERLWMLESGQSQFAGQEPQRERIVERTVNEPLPELNEQAARVQRAAEQLHGGAVESELRRPALQPFRLGDPTPLRWNGLGGGADVTEVRFTIEPHEGRFREVPFRSTLVAEIGLVHELEDVDENGRLLLALYDAAGRPLQTAQVPLAALALARRPATELLQRIREHNALWLVPAMEALPDVRYTFHLGDDAEACRLDDEENPYYRRGITLDLGLDAFLRSPERYTAPVQFDARWRDKDVTVAVLVGSTFGCTFGNGISHGWHGYRVSTHAQATLVVERATGRPLVSRYGDAEVYFLDYAEVQPGQYVPMRIAVRYGAGWHYDFHFQVVDGRVWILDRSLNAEGTAVARVDGIVVGGRKPARLQRGGEAVGLSDVRAIDWAALNERRIVRDADNPVVSAITADPRPFEHPWFAVLAALDRENQAFALDLGRSRVLQEVAFWTMSRVTRAGASSAVAGRLAGANDFRPPAVAAVPVRRQKELAVHVKSADGKTQVRSVRLKEDDRGELLAELEMVSEDYWKMFSAFASVVLLDEDDVAVACGDAMVNFRVRDDIYHLSGVMVRLGKASELRRAKHLLVGMHAIQTGQPVGSVWGTFFGFSPIFPFEQLLGNTDRDIWTYGLDALNRHLRREFHYLRQEEREEHPGRESPERELARELMPYRRSLERLLQQAAEPGALSLLCRLAGHSQDQRNEPRLVELLGHSDARVQDGAAVGLGLLGNPAGFERIKAILARAVAEKVAEPREKRELRIDARRALEALGKA